MGERGLLRHAAVIAVTLVALVGPSAAQAANVSSTWNLTVQTKTRACQSATLGGAVPIGFAEVQIWQRGTLLARQAAAANGAVRLSSNRAVRGEAVTVKVKFSTPRVRVASGETGPTYVAKIATIQPNAAGNTGGTRTLMAPDRVAPVASAFRWSHRSSRAADFANPVSALPQVRVALEFNRTLTSRVHSLGDGADVESSPPVIQVGTPGHEFEPTFLTHEFGHVLLHHVAPVNSTGGAHNIRSSYPASEGLAYDEGFSNAFAGTVLGSNTLKYDCAFYFNLGTARRPATPAPNSPRHPAFNELRTGGVFYNLAKAHRTGTTLAGRARGMRWVLAAARDWYDVNGTAPNNMRELRDAIADPLYDDSDTAVLRHQRIFGAQGIAFGAQLAVGTDVSRSPEEAGYWMNRNGMTRLSYRLTGPGGYSCEVHSDDPPTGPMTNYLLEDGIRFSYNFRRQMGPQAVGWADDCITAITGLVSVQLPPIDGNTDDVTRPWKLEVRNHCDPNDYDAEAKALQMEYGDYQEIWWTCPDSITFEAELAFGAFEGSCPNFVCAPPESLQARTANIELPTSAWVTVATWRDDNGMCDAHAAFAFTICD